MSFLYVGTLIPKVETRTIPLFPSGAPHRLIELLCFPPSDMSCYVSVLEFLERDIVCSLLGEENQSRGASFAGRTGL